MKKKFLCASFLVLLLVAGAHAESIGVLFPNVATNIGENILAAVFDKDFNIENISIKPFDSHMLMSLALNRGEIDVMGVPDFVADYIFRANPEYKMRAFIMSKNPTALAFGFLEEKKELRDRFNKVLGDMGDDGTNGIIARDFITGPKAANPEPVKIEKFDDAETVTVAITGDMPPLDYVDVGGTPAGFSTAMLAEIGRRLHLNINIINVEAGSRATALKSGRADIVFWFSVFEGYDKQPDIPEGIIVSTPYYGWNKNVLIGVKK
ncbi:MAG: transporter substrate-binding domain-containing protein [Synergistaceae bacterium]|nr:transporter substrate-binding domain-containing protein [Synergistaceae bacterium]